MRAAGCDGRSRCSIIFAASKSNFAGWKNLSAGPAIVAAKHQSTLDVLVLLLVVTRFTFIYKRELDLSPAVWRLSGAAAGRFRSTRQARRCPGADRHRGEEAKFAENPGASSSFPKGRAVRSGRPRFIRRESRGSPKRRVCPASRWRSIPGFSGHATALFAGQAEMVVEFMPPVSSGLDRENFMRVLQSQIETATDRLVAEAIDGDASLAPSATEASLSRS